jgi:hypothetical protein
MVSEHTVPPLSCPLLVTEERLFIRPSCKGFQAIPSHGPQVSRGVRLTSKKENREGRENYIIYYCFSQKRQRGYVNILLRW